MNSRFYFYDLVNNAIVFIYLEALFRTQFGASIIFTPLYANYKSCIILANLDYYKIHCTLSKVTFNI